MPLPGVVQAESDRGEGGHRDFFLLRYHSHKVKLIIYFKKYFIVYFAWIEKQRSFLLSVHATWHEGS